MTLSRKGLADLLATLRDHIALVDNVANLQKMQKELADAMTQLTERMKDLERGMGTLKVETQHETTKEMHLTLHAVQGAFHEKLSDLTLRLARLEGGRPSANAPMIALSKKAKKKRDGKNPS
jgi:hypothetical protein